MVPVKVSPLCGKVFPLASATFVDPHYTPFSWGQVPSNKKPTPFAPKRSSLNYTLLGATKLFGMLLNYNLAA